MTFTGPVKKMNMQVKFSSKIMTFICATKLEVEDNNEWCTLGRDREMAKDF